MRSRYDRVSAQKKQERLQIKDGVPSVGELTEGVPVIRKTSSGLFQYIKYRNELYKVELTRS